MMKNIYYHWLGNSTSEKGEIFLGKYQEELGDNYLRFREGKDLQNIPMYWLQITEMGSLVDFLPNVLDLYLCSSKLVTAFHELGVSNLQFFPVIIKNEDDEINDYYICNILGEVEALDESRSQFNVLDAGGGTAFKLVEWPVLKKNFESPYEVFRLYESPGWVFVSERIVNALKKSGLTGLYFEKPQ